MGKQSALVALLPATMPASGSAGQTELTDRLAASVCIANQRLSLTTDLEPERRPAGQSSNQRVAGLNFAPGPPASVWFPRRHTKKIESGSGERSKLITFSGPTAAATLKKRVARALAIFHPVRKRRRARARHARVRSTSFLAALLKTFSAATGGGGGSR